MKRREASRDVLGRGVWTGDRAGLQPQPSMLKTILLTATLCPLLCAHAATTLPVGPITFSTNADYDANFKESSFDTGNTRNAAGYVQVQGFQYGPAVFDTSASGGLNGSGGTAGSDANNDLSNFTISADLASSEVGQFGGGFLLRLNSAEANGYFAAVLSASANSVEFDLFEGSGLLEGYGPNIFSTTVPMAGVTFAINTFYPFKVTANNGTFSFDFASGAATASFTDTTVSATTGQVGFVLTTASTTSATRLDNFAIVPEPGVSCLLLFAAVAFPPPVSPAPSVNPDFQRIC